MGGMTFCSKRGESEWGPVSERERREDEEVLGKNREHEKEWGKEKKEMGAGGWKRWCQRWKENFRGKKDGIGVRERRQKSRGERVHGGSVSLRKHLFQ